MERFSHVDKINLSNKGIRRGIQSLTAPLQIMGIFYNSGFGVVGKMTGYSIKG